jgi:hypothetical protein
MASAGRRDPLDALSRELSGLGLGVGLSDVAPALAVHTGSPGNVEWISLCPLRTHFTWRLADYRHPVDDVQGAARCIADFIRGGRSNPQGT